MNDLVEGFTQKALNDCDQTLNNSYSQVAPNIVIDIKVFLYSA